jgi:hypothetical protein
MCQIVHLNCRTEFRVNLVSKASASAFYGFLRQVYVNVPCATKCVDGLGYKLDVFRVNSSACVEHI